jgi:hypothetical protein
MADDRSRARREACALLGVDIDHLAPADGLRVDMVSSLRLVIDAEQAAVLSGNQADLGKLNVAVQSLIALLPGQKLAEPAPAEGGPSDPRQIMLRTYMEMRRRGEIGKAQIEARESDQLRARIAELEAALAVSGGSNVTPAPAAPADNVVPLRTSERSEVPPSPPAAPAAVDLRATRSSGAGGGSGFRTGPSNEGWRNFTRIDWQG